jgi:hypothetical protein
MAFILSKCDAPMQKSSSPLVACDLEQSYPSRFACVVDCCIAPLPQVDRSHVSIASIIAVA